MDLVKGVFGMKLSMNRAYAWLSTWVFAFTLLACSSGSSGNSATDAGVPETGMDTGPVEHDSGPAAPVITSFTVDNSTITTGSTVNLTATFTGGTGLVDQGVGSVTSGVSVATAALTATTTFTLTVTNSVGATATAQVSVTVDPAPAISSFSADKSTITTGGTANLTAVFSGGTGAVDKGVGTVTSGTAVSTGALTATTTFTLTVTSPDGATKTAQTTVTVVPAATITSFTASPTYVPYSGGTTQLTAVFAGGTGSVDQNVGAVTSGVAVTTGTITSATTYTLTVTNPAGDSVTSPVSITVGELLVSDSPQNAVYAFPANANGTVAPARSVVSGVANPAEMTVVGDTLYLADQSNAAVATFNARATNGSSVTRIAGGNTTLNVPFGVSVYTTSGEMFVADQSNVLKVFNITDTGNVAPKRTITGVGNGKGTFVDTNGDLYVATAGSVNVYNYTDSGNVTPKRVINTNGAGSLGVLVVGNTLVVGVGTAGIMTFDKTTGVMQGQITGASTDTSVVYQCVVSTTNLLYCANNTSSSGVLAFPVTGTGNIAPTINLSNATEAFDLTVGIAFH